VVRVLGRHNRNGQRANPTRSGDRSPEVYRKGYHRKVADGPAEDDCFAAYDDLLLTQPSGGIDDLGITVPTSHGRYG
jgi:hypothetical protein